MTSGGLYTAPASPGTFHVVVTSRDDPSIAGSAEVNVTAPSAGEVLAFPGAEGFGARATGDRGGQVIRVKNLDASGPGSLQAALEVNVPRIVVFAVSAVIESDRIVDVVEGRGDVANLVAR